jgi:DNA-directed RNA polymerase specialized sigma24 family protein
VQNVLLVVFGGIGEFERRREGSFRAWLRTILANKLTDFRG